MLWSLIVLLLLAECGLLGVGLRGIRIDDHPYCRRCRYDLLRLASSSRACPECGARLAGKRAVRTGRRRRQGGLIVLGVLFLLPTIVAGSVLAWRDLRDVDWNTLKPVWWLRKESVSANSVEAFSARSELLMRLDESLWSLTEARLSTAQIKDLVSDGLMIQADPDATWSSQWGELIELAWIVDRGWITEDQLTQYLRNAFQPGIRFTTRTRVRDRSCLPIRIEYGPFRSCSRSRFAAYLRVESATLGSQPLTTGILRERCEMSSVTTLAEVKCLFQSLPPGNHDLTLRYRTSVTVVGGDYEGQTLAEWQSTAKLHVTVVPRSSAVVRQVRDDRLSDAARAAVTISPIRMGAASDGFDIGQFLRVKRPPVDFAMDVTLRSKAKELKVGELIALKQGGLRVNPAGPDWITYSFLSDLGVVDVVLSPKEGVAERTVEISEMWSREIVIEGVPVRGPAKDGAD